MYKECFFHLLCQFSSPCQEAVSFCLLEDLRACVLIPVRSERNANAKTKWILRLNQNNTGLHSIRITYQVMNNRTVQVRIGKMTKTHTVLVLIIQKTSQQHAIKNYKCHDFYSLFHMN